MDIKFEQVKYDVFSFIFESYRHETTHGTILLTLGKKHEIPMINKALTSLLQDGKIFEEANKTSPDYTGSFWA